MKWIKDHPVFTALIIILAIVVIWYFFFNTKIKFFGSFAAGGRAPAPAPRPAPTPIPSRPVIIPRPVNPENERWVITCDNISSNKVCCWASTESGSVVSSVQCSSFRKSDAEYIQAAKDEVAQNRKNIIASAGSETRTGSKTIKCVTITSPLGVATPVCYPFYPIPGPTITFDHNLKLISSTNIDAHTVKCCYQN